MPTAQTETQKAYDFVAKEYANEFRDELSKKPFDRKMLDWLVEKVNGAGQICDMGCGPGQLAGYLSARGIDARGIDLSAEMVQQAKTLNPDVHFQQGDMLALTEIGDDTFGGIAAFYSIIHIARPLVVDALRELKRTLRPRGVLLITFHIGQETVHRDEFLGKEISLDFHFFETGEMKSYLADAGFVLEEVITRDPYADVEYPSRRAYIFARKPQQPIN
ncbi:MAG TPA: class I SAM-dependent methyltransferase [Pyrinomonadaceae bacterium]